MSEHKKRISVVHKSVYGSVVGDEYGDDTIYSVIEWLQSVLEGVPEEYRSSAKLEVDSVGGYEGEHHSELTIYYDRPETTDEKQARHDREIARAKEEEQLGLRRLADAKARLERLEKEKSH